MRDNARLFNNRFINKLFAQSEKQPSVFLDSSGELCIYGCEGLIEYSDVFVRIKTLKTIISVYGSGLILNTFSNREITVNGQISRIDLEGEN